MPNPLSAISRISGRSIVANLRSIFIHPITCNIMLRLIMMHSLMAAHLLADSAFSDWDTVIIKDEPFEEPSDLVEEESCLDLEIQEEIDLQYIEGIKRFSNKVLQKKIKESTSENQLISPLGISFLLSMLKHGVGIENQIEIENIVELPRDENALKKSSFGLINRLKKNGLDIAGLLYLNEKYQLNPNYQSLVCRYYLSKVKSGHSAHEINGWVEEMTNGQIKKLVNQSDLHHFFVLVANAIHFKADWAVQFKKMNTYPDSFLTPTGVIQTAMMHKTDRVDYVEHDDYQAIRLPYDGTLCSMLLILPKEENDFSFIEHSNLETILKGLKSQIVKIGLPIFKIEQEVNVKELLHHMGMTSLFQHPDFAPLIDQQHLPSLAALSALEMTQMKQKSVLVCDEQGIEASSLTSGTIKLTSAPQPLAIDRRIIFNRPFLVVLLGPQVPILFGIIRDPSS